MSVSDVPEPIADPNVVETEERLVGTTARGMAGSAVLLSLARAARSFLLYDPTNEAIRHFLSSLRTSADAYFAAYGKLDLQVRPFELALEGEVVYLDRDRERSLAFRLFRDGVRRLVLASDVSWHELLKFLEIMSIRYTGVRQAEDDMVVLLWKAGFKHIQVEAVEGLVADDDGEDDAIIRAQAGTFAASTEDFDLPAPELPDPVDIAPRAVPEEALRALQEEDTTQAVPGLCVRLLRELVAAAQVPGGIPFSESLPALRELRDFLLGEGTLDPLLASVRTLRDAELPDLADADARDALVLSFVDASSLARLLRSVPRDATGASPEMVEFLRLLPGEHLRTLVHVLTLEKGEAARRVARSLIERYVATHGAWMVETLVSADADVASELLRAIAHASVDQGLAAADRVVGRREVEVEFEILHLLARAPVGPTVVRLVSHLAASPHDEIRLRALDLVRTRAIHGAFRPLVENLKRVSPIRLETSEATVAGEAMARADPSAALVQFREWTRPPGMFSVVLPGHIRLHYVCVAGLASLPGDEPEKLITALKARADPDLQRFIVQSMIQRRRNARSLA
jgi:hypothetical protein